MIARGLLVVGLSCAAPSLAAAERPPPCEPFVSVPELLANPGAFEGKRVWVTAMVSTGIENMFACVADHDLHEGCLWVELEDGSDLDDRTFAELQAKVAALERFAHQTVALHATFNANQPTRGAQWRGEISHLTELIGREAGWNFVEGVATPRNACAHGLPDETSEEMIDRGDFAAALARLDRAIAGDPAKLSNWRMRAHAKKQLGDYAGAIADYTHVLESGDDDKSPDLWFRGQVRELAGDLAGAIADYSHAIRIEPKFEPFFRSRASARRKAGDIRGAAADLERAEALQHGR